MPIFLAVCKQLDGLSGFYYQVTHVIHKSLFFLKAQTRFWREHKHIPIGIIAGITTGTRPIQPHFRIRIYLMHILLYLPQHPLIGCIRSLVFDFHCQCFYKCYDYKDSRFFLIGNPLIRTKSQRAHCLQR